MVSEMDGGEDYFCIDSKPIEECREVEPQRNQRRGFQQVVRLIRAGQV
jgi:hypothetical protein